LVIDALQLAVAGAFYVQTGDLAEAARLLKAASRAANRAAFRLDRVERRRARNEP
jgi:hypothetical protein